MSLTVTERAAEALKETLNGVDHEAGEVLRLVPGAQDPKGQLALALDRARDGDQVVEHEGAAVLVVEKELSESLSASTLDAEEGLDGPQLRLIPV